MRARSSTSWPGAKSVIWSRLARARRAVLDGVEIVAVTPAAAGGDVPAPAALERIGARVADEPVGLGRADRTLDAGEQVGLAAALGGIRGAAQIDDDPRPAEGEGGEIHPGAAVQLVVARPAVEQVAAAVGVQGVGAAQPPQQVVALECGDACCRRHCR